MGRPKSPKKKKTKTVVKPKVRVLRRPTPVAPVYTGPAYVKGRNAAAAIKFSQGRNASGSVTFAGEETGNEKTWAIGRNFKVALMQARTAKKWSQEQLARMLNVKPNVITQYEQGKVVPNGQLIAKMNRVLGVKLPKIRKPKKLKE